MPEMGRRAACCVKKGFSPTSPRRLHASFARQALLRHIWEVIIVQVAIPATIRRPPQLAINAPLDFILTLVAILSAWHAHQALYRRNTHLRYANHALPGNMQNLVMGAVIAPLAHIPIFLVLPNAPSAPSTLTRPRRIRRNARTAPVR